MEQSNYFVEIRRRALEIDWRVPISIFEDGIPDGRISSDLLLAGKYVRVEKDLLIVAPGDHGFLFHRYFDSDVFTGSSPLKLRPGLVIPMTWPLVMSSAPLLAMEAQRPVSIETVGAAGIGFETAAAGGEVMLGGSFRCTLSKNTRLWLIEGGPNKGWACRLLRGSLFCEALVGRSSSMRIETLRGQGRLGSGAVAVQMLEPRLSDVVVASRFGSGEPPRWDMGGFGYSLSASKPMLSWTQSGGAPDSGGFEGLKGNISAHLAGALNQQVDSRETRSAHEVAKPYRAPPAASAKSEGSQVKGVDMTTHVASSTTSSRGGHSSAVRPITIVDKPIYGVPKFDGEIELRLSVDQGSLHCRRPDDIMVDGAGTGSLLLRGPMSAVNNAIETVGFEPPQAESVARPALAPGITAQRHAVMITLFARIGGRMFETSIPLEEFLAGSGHIMSR